MSESEIYLLSLFLKARRPESITAPGWNELWLHSLKEDPRSVISRFVAQGFLVPATALEILDITHRVADLAALCDRYALNPKGRKAELIDRLGTIPSSELQGHVKNAVAFVCSAKGKVVAEKMKHEMEAALKIAEDSALGALKQNQLQNACEIVKQFQRQYPLSQGIGNENGHRDFRSELERLKSIFAKHETNFADEQVDHDRIRLAAGMSILWGTTTERWLPRDPTSKRKRRTKEEIAEERNARMTVFAANHEATLRQYRNNRDVLVGVEILAASSSCEYCKNHAGRFRFENVPTLPHTLCTHEMGCRCCYAPLTELSDL